MTSTTMCMRFAMACKFCFVAMTQHPCFAMHMLIDSVPNEVIRASLMGLDESCGQD